MADTLRSPNFETEPLAEGVPNLRSPLVQTEPLAEGIPNLRVDLLQSEPLTEGAPNLRVDLFITETLISLWPDIPMSTAVFPTLPGLTWSVHKKPQFSTRISKQQAGREVRSADYPMPIWEFDLTYDFLPDPQDANQDLTTNLRQLMGFFLQRQGSYDTFLFQDPTDYIVVSGLQWTGDAATLRFPVLRNLGGFEEIIGQVNTSALTTFSSTAVNTSTNTFNVPNHGLVTADSPVAIKSSATLPSGLVSTTTYWLIAVDANTLALASSYANALAGTKVTLTTTGSGNLTISRDIAVYDNGTLLNKTAYSISGPNYLLFSVAPAAGHLITADFWFYFNVRFLEDAHDYEQFMENLWQLGKCDLLSVIP